jgi:antitoxin CptB
VDGYCGRLMINSIDGLEARRRRLLWRAEHRGTREMDLVLGGFARARLAGMDAAGLDEFEAIVAASDPDLARWLIGRESVPSERRSATLAALLAYRP